MTNGDLAYHVIYLIRLVAVYLGEISQLVNCVLMACPLLSFWLFALSELPEADVKAFICNN